MNKNWKDEFSDIFLYKNDWDNGDVDIEQFVCDYLMNHVERLLKDQTEAIITEIKGLLGKKDMCGGWEAVDTVYVRALIQKLEGKK